MYKEIGEIFEYKGVKLQVIEAYSIFCMNCPLYLRNAKECNTLIKDCKDCYFYHTHSHCDKIACLYSERKDNKNVIFKKVQ